MDKNIDMKNKKNKENPLPLMKTKNLLHSAWWTVLQRKTNVI